MMCIQFLISNIRIPSTAEKWYLLHVVISKLSVTFINYIRMNERVTLNSSIEMEAHCLLGGVVQVY